MFGIKPAARAPVEKPARPGLLGRLGGALKRTRESLTSGVADLFGGKSRIQVDDDFFEAIETLLLAGDVGVSATESIMQDMHARIQGESGVTETQVLDALRDSMATILAPVAVPLEIPEGRDAPYVILVVGVNGAGKTTTIGKLASRFKAQGREVMLAAGDTFRAAAVEQLQAWGERNTVPVIAQQSGADSASVIFDALQAARARGADLLIADTAGRLHTQDNLMQELKKVKRVLGKLDNNAPHEVLLVLDAGIGQNALAQAREFHAAVGVTGIALTKLDGTAKGGIVISIAQQMGLPIRFIGVGEGIEDLREFKSVDFVDALLML